MGIKKISTLLVLILALGIIFFINKQDEKCVNLYVDFGSLNYGEKITKCVDTNSKITALDVLNKGNLRIEGTKKYGLGVVCRINGLPNAKIESCETMPPANSYWAIIIKEKQLLPFPTNAWGWAQLSVDEQLLNPGDSIGFVFTENGKVNFP
jgi:hypothetical protein